MRYQQEVVTIGLYQGRHSVAGIPPGLCGQGCAGGVTGGGGRDLADIGMSLNVGKCAYATAARIPSIMVHLSPHNAVAP